MEIPERMDKNRLPKQEASKMTSTTASRAGFPPPGQNQMCLIFTAGKEKKKNTQTNQVLFSRDVFVARGKC